MVLRLTVFCQNLQILAINCGAVTKPCSGRLLEPWRRKLAPSPPFIPYRKHAAFKLKYQGHFCRVGHPHCSWPHLSCQLWLPLLCLYRCEKELMVKSGKVSGVHHLLQAQSMSLCSCLIFKNIQVKANKAQKLILNSLKMGCLQASVCLHASMRHESHKHFQKAYLSSCSCTKMPMVPCSLTTNSQYPIAWAPHTHLQRRTVKCWREGSQR